LGILHKVCVNIKRMKALLKLISSRHFWPLVVVVIFAILAGRSLIFESGYFNMHDDLQMMRQLQLEKCFADGQIPCRWIQDMGYGFGFPLFNFYPPLPYLIGQAIRLIGFSFVNTVKLNFALSIIVSGIAMYFLAKEFFGRLGGVLSAVFYVWAPYHAVDVYVRGAMNEAWALAWFPLIFWAGYRLVISKKREGTRWIIVLALAYFALFTSHNLMVLILTPFFAVWVLLHLWREGAWRKIPQLILSGTLAFGLAAFFTLPALLENKFTQVRSQLVGYYDFTAHFVSIRQLLTSRFWGYGPSVWGVTDDRMSFQVGHIHWILSIVVAATAVLRLLVRSRGSNPIKKLINADRITHVALFFIAVGWIAAFLTHSRSTPIWLAIDQMKFIQFPWRFLAIVIFAFSFIVGVIPGIIAEWKSRHRFLAKLVATPAQILFSLILILSLILLNWNYFKPEGGKMGVLTDEEKFRGAAWELQQTAGIYDYLPIDAETAPTGPQKETAEIMEGEGEIIKPTQGTYWAKFNANIESETAIIRLGIFQFPNWRAFVDGVEVDTFVAEDEKWGRIYFKIPSGEHLVYAQLFNTPVRTAGNLISWAGLLSFPLWRRRSKAVGH